jgi:hypothetical protein
MIRQLVNVKADLRSKVSQDSLSSELSRALEGLFEITGYRRFVAYKGSFVSLYAKPTRTIANALLIDREVLALVANYSDLQVRTISVIREQIAREQPRLHPSVVIVMHADPDGDQKLRAWGREESMTVLPLFRAPGAALPPTALVRQRLSHELFSTDSFQVTGPVHDDADFFGRREQALDILRQLQAGRIVALFGLRKVGKTSMINRIIDHAVRQGNPRVAMVDCSLRSFSDLGAEAALRALARLSKIALDRGYAHISQVARTGDRSLLDTYDSLWQQGRTATLLIVLDEVDYITPDSPTSPHWRNDFNDFWREFRALVQEGRRHALSLSVLVSGISSRYFRIAEVEGVENSVLHFVPEEYLSPFPAGAADSMLATLGKRCGLIMQPDARALLAREAAYMPFWIRMAGSYLHRKIEIESRPSEVSIENVSAAMDDFVQSEGAEIARIALQSFRRTDPTMFEALKHCIESGSIPAQTARPLLRYGLVRQMGAELRVESRMVLEGLRSLSEASASEGRGANVVSLNLEDSEWAEELASLARRRNLLERKSREFIRLVLKMSPPSSQANWVDVVLAALPEPRRLECKRLAPDLLLNKLYWVDLGNIIARNWQQFERFFNDKRRFQSAWELVNDRPDAHAKEADLADIALQRREITWLEERITK